MQIKEIKYSQHLIVVMALSATLLGCRDYKDLAKVPATNTKQMLRDVNSSDSKSNALDSVSWKSYYTDSHLQALIAEGIENNYNMQLAVSRISQSEITLNMTKLAQTPTVAAAAGIDHTRLSTGKHGTDVFGYYSNVNSLGLSLSWEADLWGKLNSQTKAKYAAYLNTIENKKLVQITLISNIAKNYYSLEALDEQLRTTNENIVLQQKTVETMQALKDAGQTTQAAVEQSKAQLYSTQLSAYSLESQIHQTENAISVLIGRNPGPVARGTIADQSIPEVMNGNIPVSSLANRPDVKQAELAVQSAYALTDVAKKSLYPSLNVSSLTLGFVNGDFSNFFSPAHLAGELVLSLSQPLWAKGQLKANLKLNQAQQADALKTFSYTMLTAGQEVSDILFTYQSSVKKNEWRNKQVESLLKSVDYTQDLLKAGEATYTEVLTAQQSLLAAELNKTSDKLEQLTQSVNLYRALGGGIK